MRISVKSGLLCTVALALAPIAVAQNVEEKESRQETVVVTSTPIRDSQLAAIEAKKDAGNIVDILAADTIGRFPDQNLADSLGRVPGLAIERDQGQARFINFRGAPFRYTKIAFDGIDVLGAEDGRTPRFDAFPSVITSKIAVNKAITADMPGESTIGYVNIDTYKPFDKEGLHVSLEGGLGKQQLGDDDIEKVNGRASYSNDVFGLLVFGSHNLRGRITDNREYSYLDLNRDGTDDAVESIDFRSYRGEREDNAYGGRLEFRPTSDSTVFLSSLYSEFIDREERNQYVFDFNTPVAMGTETYAPVIVVTRMLEDGKYENSTFSNTLGYDGVFGEWEVGARINYTETENSTFLPIPYSAGGVVGGNVDVTNIFDPKLSLTQVGQPGTTADVNHLSYAMTFGLFYVGETNTEATKFKLDAERDLTLFGYDTRLKIGGQFDTREANGGSAQAYDFASLAGVDINNYVTSALWDSDFSNTIDATNIDNVGLRKAWDAAAGGLTAEFTPDSLISIEEDVTALYAMATSKFDWGSLVYGLRVEQTDFTSAGTMIDPVTGNPVQVSASNDYTNVLPSLHANFDITDDLKIRLSASTGLSRPTYTEARASQSVNTTSTPFEISGGNPFLDPETSVGVDATIEWYFAPASLLSAGVYHRRIDNVIYPASSTVDGSVYAPGLIAPGTPTTFNSFFNGEDGAMTGFELNFMGTAEDWLPAPFDGLGVSGNLTLVDSSFYAPNLAGKFSMPGTSDTVYNASVFYEKFGLSARLNYQFRSAWLSTTENDSLSEYWGDTERVDASLRYTLPNPVFGTSVTLALNGNNLTDERDTRYINTSATPNQYEGFGRRWVASIRIDY